MKVISINPVTLICLLSTVLFLIFVGSTQVYALDPSEETLSCFGNEEGTSIDGRPCSEVNCDWRNTANNWPDDTGYEEDCSTGYVKTSSNNMFWLYTAIGAGLLTTGLVYLVFIRRVKRQP